MTIVTYRDGVMAADTGAFDSFDCYTGKVRKLLHHKSGALIGVCGTMSLATKYLAAVFKTNNPLEVDIPFDDNGAVLIVVGPDEVYHASERGHVQLFAPFYAMGSGAPMALGAMHAGAGPVRAAEIACLVDAHCRGPIETIGEN